MSIGQLATLACILEVTIPKPGNVHRGADFADMTLGDFLVSALAIGPPLDRAPRQSLGETVWQCVKATRGVVTVNTNLGLILLLSPLAAQADSGNRHWQPSALQSYLQATTATDCQRIYQAIALCQPGGLGRAADFDVHLQQTPENIVAAMRLASDRDMIARQYVLGFRDVLEFVLPQIQVAVQGGHALTEAVIQAHLKTMQEFPDSLIARKNGPELAQQSAAMAADVLSSGEIGGAEWLRAVRDFDFWLRADGNRRNPGTTADLIGAALFAGLCDGSIAVGPGQLR